jgi:hypothetical protein
MARHPSPAYTGAAACKDAQRLREALKAKRYAYQYVWAQDAGHVERGVERQTLEEAMDWVWKRQ